jgi:enoyl-CoA hydratase/carnithine racemase
MHYEFINLSQDGGVAVLRLNRPDNLNAWNQQMRDELRDAVNTLIKGEQVPVEDIVKN